MELFQPIELTATEEDIVLERLSNPAVQKYFKLLANKCAVNILTADVAKGQSAEEHLRNVARAQGQLECLETLASSFSPKLNGAS